MSPGVYHQPKRRTTATTFLASCIAVGLGYRDRSVQQGAEQMNNRFRPSLPVAVSILLLALVLLMGVAYLASRWSRPPEDFSYERYLDRDLTTSSNREQLDLAIWLDRQLNSHERVGFQERPAWMFWRRPEPICLWESQPWYFWLMKTGDGTTRLVLLECDVMMDIPGGTSLTIRVFDLEGTHLTSTRFWMGWRTVPETAAKRFDVDLAADVIEIDSVTDVPRGGRTERIYVGIVEDRTVLLRVEDDGGRYCSPHGRHDERAGPPVPECTVEEWQQALQSATPLLVLEAILWLDGRNVWGPGLNDRHRKAVKQHPATHPIVRQLAESPHPWIKETALQVLQPAP
jgi:hypothetical protein